MMNVGDAADLASQLKEQVSQAVFGQETLIEEALCCLLSGGHLLMTGAPGLAKTTLVRVIANHLGLEFGRVQFTPDLLPSDITGSEILDIDAQTGKRHFEFSKGPVFVNLLLADEINRASPRTQSALLESMQERTTTVNGKRHPLPDPFMVFATQNPFESEGTFPLPEAQMDRFLIHTLVDYPDPEAEMKILTTHVAGGLAGEARELATAAHAIDIHKLRDMIKAQAGVNIAQPLLDTISELVRSTRPSDSSCPDHLRTAIWYGAGPRAGISLISTSRSLALMEGTGEVRWRHIRRLAKPVLRHRIRLTAQAIHDGLNEDGVVEELLQRIEQNHRDLASGQTE